jgi:hypothetical protein
MSFGVLGAVELHDDLVREAREIDHKGADGSLAAEPKPLQLVGAQQSPETLFGGRYGGAQASGEVALV